MRWQLTSCHRHLSDLLCLNPILAPAMHDWYVHSVAKAPILGTTSRSMDPSQTKRFLFDLRLFLDPDAILAVAKRGALIVKWILRGLETSEVAGACAPTRGSQVHLTRG